jgi:hypothetical protein
MRQFPLIGAQNEGLSRLLRFTSVLVSSLGEISETFKMPVIRSLTGGLAIVLEAAQVFLVLWLLLS